MQSKQHPHVLRTYISYGVLFQFRMSEFKIAFITAFGECEKSVSEKRAWMRSISIFTHEVNQLHVPK